MKKASIIMMLGSLLLLGLFVFPLWNIKLGAPQYPDPLGLDIFINGLQGQEEFDIQNIDGLNHYIGMKTLPKPGEMWEFTYFPYILIGSVAIGFIIGLLGFLGKIKPYWFLVWFIIMAILASLGIYDFYVWLNNYGSDLDPNAILKIVDKSGNPMSYSPPIIGHKVLLNFDVYSYPRLGGIMLGAGILFSLLAYVIGIKSKR